MIVRESGQVIFPGLSIMIMISTKTPSIQAFTGMKFAIWSVSIVTSITGLAISPSLPAIQKTFPQASESVLDMLISLPNLLLIPFVIIAGKLAQSKSKMTMIQGGALVFIIAAVLYQFAHSIAILLLISVGLGIGAGLIVPLSAQLPSVVFKGKERQQQLGICSGISNATQVFCTFAAGWLATINWHYSFWVYGIALIPLLLSPFLRYIPKFTAQVENKTAKTEHNNTVDPSVSSTLSSPKEGIQKNKLVLLMILYFVVMFFNLQIPISLPFLLNHHHLNTEVSGILIAIFFMVQALSAFMINTIIRIFRSYTIFVVILVITVALFLFPMVRGEGWYYVLAACAGITGGTIEPLIWNKTAAITSQKSSTVAFGWIMSACYMSVWATPYLLDFFSKIFKDDLSTFPFYISGGIALLFSVLLLFTRNQQIFGMKDEMKEFGTH